MMDLVLISAVGLFVFDEIKLFRIFFEWPLLKLIYYKYPRLPLDFLWTPSGHPLDTLWTSSGHPLDTLWTPSGHLLDTPPSRCPLNILWIFFIQWSRGGFNLDMFLFLRNKAVQDIIRRLFTDIIDVLWLIEEYTNDIMTYKYTIHTHDNFASKWVQ